MRRGCGIDPLTKRGPPFFFSSLPRSENGRANGGARKTSAEGQNGRWGSRGRRRVLCVCGGGGGRGVHRVGREGWWWRERNRRKGKRFQPVGFSCGSVGELIARLGLSPLPSCLRVCVCVCVYVCLCARARVCVSRRGHGLPLSAMSYWNWDLLSQLSLSPSFSRSGRSPFHFWLDLRRRRPSISIEILVEPLDECGEPFRTVVPLV